MQTLRLFSDVARCQSFSQAAGMHGITQSAASQRIGHLEKRLGVTLLDRSVRPLELTEAGTATYAPSSDQHPAGDVRVAAIYSSGIDLLSRVRRRFEKEQPKVSVRIEYEYPDTVYDAVVNGRADVGILSYPERFRKVGVIPLRDEPMAVVCPPGHALAELDSVTPELLTGHERVAFSNDLPIGRRISAYLKENNGAPTTKYVFDNLDTIKGAVAAMGRFAILPARTGIIYRRGARQSAPLSPAAALFVDFLIEHTGPTVTTAQLNHVHPTDVPDAEAASGDTDPAKAASKSKPKPAKKTARKGASS